MAGVTALRLMSAKYALWLDFEGPEPSFQRFAHLSEKAVGLQQVGFRDMAGRSMETWFQEATALVVHSGVYLDQDEVLKAFTAALRRGIRVLVLRASVSRSGVGQSATRHGDANPWLTGEFDMGFFDDFHQDTQRWSEDGWASQERTLLVGRPADPLIRLHPLLAGVSELLVDSPRVVRCFRPRARPLVAVKVTDVITAQDLVLPPSEVTDEDACIGAVWTAPEAAAPQLVALGDAGLLSDRLLPRADNERLALNLIHWLAAHPSSHDLSAAAERLVDEIDLTLSELVIGVLTEANAPAPWWEGIPEDRLRALRQGTMPLERALNPLDKIKLAGKNASLSQSVVCVGGRSKTKGMSFWGSVSAIRNRIKHRERLLDEPIDASDVAVLEQAAAAVRKAHREWSASLEDDPRRLP